jgi:hypothetical protein
MSVTRLTTTMPVTRIITAHIPITTVDTGRAGMVAGVIVAGGEDITAVTTAGFTVVSVGSVVSMAAVLRFAVGADSVAVDMEAADMEAVADTASSPLSHA